MLAHSVMIAPFAIVLISVSLAQVDRRIDLAARDMGARLATRIIKVIVPNIRFGLIVSIFITIVLSWEEIAITLFFTSVGAVTLPRLISMELRDNKDPAIAAVSVVLIVIVAGAHHTITLFKHCRSTLRHQSRAGLHQREAGGLHPSPPFFVFTDRSAGS